MKKLSVFIIGMIYGHCVMAQTDPCANGGLEYNDFSNWQTYTGTNDGGAVDLGLITPGVVPGRHTIVGTGFDPILTGLGVSMPRVDEGNYALQLGNSGTDAQADLARYTFNVTAANQDFGFRYAMVLQDPGHTPDEQPFVSYIIYEGTGMPNFFPGMSNVITSEKWVADSNNPFFKSVGGVVYKDWSTECIDLSNYIGKTVSILFVTADCSQGGHYGYAYIDGLCSETDPVAAFTIGSELCLGDGIYANGIPSEREDSYFWSVQESTAGWVPIGPEYSEWFVADQAGIISLKSFVEGKGGTIKCDTYYRVKLAVGNECNPWVAETKLIHIKCPNAVELKDRYICCGSTGAVLINPLGNGLTHQWDVSPGTNYVNTTNGGIIVTPTQTTTVHVTYSDGDCTGEQEMKIWVIDGLQVTITSEPYGCCSQKLTAHVTVNGGDCPISQSDAQELISKLNFQWSNGETGQSIIVSGENEQSLSVDVGLENGLFNTCYNAAANYTYVPSGPYMNTSLYSKELIAPNSFTPQDGVNSIYRIYEFGMDAPLEGEPYAYGITGYQLTVFNRWGQIVYDHVDESCNIPQGDISWDGRDNAGNYVQGGVYVFRLRMKTCSGWHDVCSINGLTQGGDICVDGYVSPFTWPPFSFVCTDYLTPGTGDLSDITCIFSVNVIY